MNAQDWINELHLSPHPEGGFYRETYRSIASLPGNSLEEFPQKRNIGTAIYFLLPAGKISAFHKIKSDEIWFYHAGDPLQLTIIDERQGLIDQLLGIDLKKGQSPQLLIPAGKWFGASVKAEEGFTLVSCTVTPGFDFEDFEIGERATLLHQYPQHKDAIVWLTH